MIIKRVVPIWADRFLYVAIETENGLVGYGECGTWGHFEVAAAAIEKSAEYLVGREARTIEHHWNVLTRWSHFRGSALFGAVSAIDIALWDLKGKAFDAPVYELLGGPTRKRARVYGHVKAPTLELMIKRCLELKQRGFTAIGHLNPFLDEDRSVAYFKPHAAKLAEAADNVRQIRKAVGEEVDLCIEIHRRLGVAEAIVFASMIEPYRPLFYEDPISPENNDSMAEVVNKTRIPVATGERFSSPAEFDNLFRRCRIAYARISLCLCGGITGARKIAAAAEAKNILIVPHNPLSPLSLAACLQLDAAIPNFALQEYPTSQDNWENGWRGSGLRGDYLVDEVPEMSDGFVAIPARPGIGMNLIPHVGEKFPKVGRPIAMRNHRDGFVVDQ